MLTPGSRLGVYQITALLGEGGMGQVFRARDTKLDRDVAIKVLPEAFAHDAERLARFTREAKTLASLNHPNIAAIYGLEESPSTSSAQARITALVMELVEGDDLSQRIARLHAPGASARQAGMPLDEALPIAKQIAEALEAAHEQGIIHRDLKPANIKVRADGTVKVLDFGLAKALDPAAASSPEAMNSPTITSPAMTEAGMILGTAAYMAPEQARGTAVDKRADVWAFGVVLYEMLTATRLFGGTTMSDTIAAVLTREPDWATLPAGTPAPIRKLLRRCLEKDRKRRLDSAGAARLEIDDALTASPTEDGPSAAAAPAATASARGRRPWMVAIAAVVGMVAMATPTLRYLRQTPPPVPPETRLEIATPATGQPASFALSPDGRQIVFAADSDGASRLWLRPLASTSAQPLAGTEGAAWPFWSPDSRSIGFFVLGSLKRLDLGGGVPQTLAPAPNGFGGTWSAEGVIVFAAAQGAAVGLMRVAATGGAAVVVATPGPTALVSVAPSFLPDGRRFLFYQGGTPDTTGIYLGALDGRAPIRLTTGNRAAAAYLPSGPGGADASRDGGWLLWTREGTLVAQRLDLATATLTGEPVTVADGVTAVSVAATGLVSYRMGASSQRQLVWFDRSGTARGRVGNPDATFNSLRVSPDGRRVALYRTVQGNDDIWLLDAERMSRFTFDPAAERHPQWSPDGTRIVFHSNRTGTRDLYVKAANGAGVEERVVASDQFKTPTSWSPDGRFLLYQSTGPQTLYDLWVVPMVGEPTPSVFLKTSFSERWGTFSPDGRWVAYQSDESGREEIYVRPFVPPGAATVAGGQWQVSTAGGAYAAWRPDGKELYYLDPAGAMMAAPIAVAGSGVVPGTPVVLFPTNIFGGGVTPQGFREYDVAPDGRFLINAVVESAAAPITLIMNWRPERKQ